MTATAVATTDRLLCECWCGRTHLYVPVEWIGEGRTDSCGTGECNPGCEAQEVDAFEDDVELDLGPDPEAPTTNTMESSRPMNHDYDHTADSSPGENMQAVAREEGVLALDQSVGRCGCGCQAATAPKSRFLPGHDAKLKSKLMRAAAADVPVRRFGVPVDTASAMDVAREYGWEEHVEKGADRIKRRSQTPLAAEKRVLKAAEAGREGWTLVQTARWGVTKRAAAVWSNDTTGAVEVHYVTPEGTVEVAPMNPTGA